MDFDRILPRLFVGVCPRTPDHIDQLTEQYGITAVLNLQTEEDFAYWGIDWEELAARYQERGVEVRRVPVQDFNAEDLRRRLPDCVSALDELLQRGHTVYLHCSGGINRSPSTAVAYLHWLQQLPLHEALAHVLNCRSCDPYREAIHLATEDRLQRRTGSDRE